MIAIDRSVAGVTVRLAPPATEPEFAVIVVAPTAAPVASPVLEMLATVLDDVQIADEVRSFVLPSVYVPMALNC